tara:strand:- start:3882 stop:4472 length:591 start_codon:yes stop_codon:yes gene_type:complete
MNKPDYNIEQFWLGLKNSMINFYYKKIIKRPILKWSDNLNELQKVEKYDDIEKNIRNYISLYGIDLMRYMDFYHLNILKTNIKRWNNISNRYGFNKEETKKYYNIIFLLIDIYEKLYNTLSENDFTEFSTEIELLIIYEDFNSLIDICVKYKLESIIDKLSNYIDVLKILNTKYNLNLKHILSGRKLFKLIDLDNK